MMVRWDKCHWCNKPIVVCDIIPDDDYQKANAVHVVGGESQSHIGFACKECEKMLQQKYPQHSYGFSGIPGDIDLFL